MKFKDGFFRGLLFAIAGLFEKPKIIYGPRRADTSPLYDVETIKALELSKGSGQYKVILVRLENANLPRSADDENLPCVPRLIEDVIDRGPVAEKDLPARFSALEKIHFK